MGSSPIKALYRELDQVRKSGLIVRDRDPCSRLAPNVSHTDILFHDKVLLEVSYSDAYTTVTSIVIGSTQAMEYKPGMLMTALRSPSASYLYIQDITPNPLHATTYLELLPNEILCPIKDMIYDYATARLNYLKYLHWFGKVQLDLIVLPEYRYRIGDLVCLRYDPAIAELLKTATTEQQKRILNSNR